VSSKLTGPDIDLVPIGPFIPIKIMLLNVKAMNSERRETVRSAQDRRKKSLSNEAFFERSLDLLTLSF
jgi:hypothetical protein